MQVLMFSLKFVVSIIIIIVNVIAYSNKLMPSSHTGCPALISVTSALAAQEEFGQDGW
jgi:hypothetical protein